MRAGERGARFPQESTREQALSAPRVQRVHEALRQVNPSIIYASMSGFGQTGPYGRKGGFDIIAQGMSGIMTMTGEPNGRPAKVGIAMNDIASGVTCLYGILGAYLPPFGRIVGQMQHDLFHVYTVDQHILMVLRNVRRFFIAEHAHDSVWHHRIRAARARRDLVRRAFCCAPRP